MVHCNVIAVVVVVVVVAAAAAATFLGVILDVSLSFVPHVDNTVRKVKEKTRVLLRHLSTKEWGWTQDKLRQVYISYIRSVIDYCAPAWQPWLSETVSQV